MRVIRRVLQLGTRRDTGADGGEGDLEDRLPVIPPVGDVSPHESTQLAGHGETQANRCRLRLVPAQPRVRLEDAFLVPRRDARAVVLYGDNHMRAPVGQLNGNALSPVAVGVGDQVTKNLAEPERIGPCGGT